MAHPSCASIEQRRAGASDRIRWALVGSAWVHFGLVVSLALARPPLPVPDVGGTHLLLQVERWSDLGHGPPLPIAAPPPQLPEPDAAVVQYVRIEEQTHEQAETERIAAHTSAGTPARVAAADARPRGAPRPEAPQRAGTEQQGAAEEPAAVGAAGGRPGDDPLPEAPDGRRARAERLHGDARDVDPVRSFRASMGWAEITVPDGGRVGQRADRDAPLVVDAPIDVRADQLGQESPLGRYIHRVEDVLLTRWSDRELPLAQRAAGIQGVVAVRYRIQRNGSVEGLRVVRSSGIPELDLLALRTVPDRLPRIPRAVGLSSLEHQVSLRYDNPLIARSTP